jgi:VIT1/CCC1 family predicted Fe2+/Mn2+ transporter
MTLNANSILALIATAAALVAFLIMLQESIALGQGNDPFSNGVRAVTRRFPRVTFAVAVVFGMLLGHFFWP